jgi:hypothetical protein
VRAGDESWSCLFELELGGFGRDLTHLSDQVSEVAVVGDPFLVELGLGLGESSGDGLAVELGGPLVVRAVRLGSSSCASGRHLPGGRSCSRPRRLERERRAARAARSLGARPHRGSVCRARSRTAPRAGGPSRSGWWRSRASSRSAGVSPGRARRRSPHRTGPRPRRSPSPPDRRRTQRGPDGGPAPGGVAAPGWSTGAPAAPDTDGGSG